MKDYKSMDDYSLICECLRGDDDAFADLLRRYKNLVFSVIKRMVNDSEEANDLAQEVFIKTYRNLDKYQPEFKFSTWIIRISTNHVIDYRRKKKQDVLPIDEIPFEPAYEETPEKVVLERERNTTLMQALNTLPDMYKVPLLLYHQHNYSYNEISDIISEPLSKVKNRIFRGRKMLKDILTNVDVKEGVVYEM